MVEVKLCRLCLKPTLASSSLLTPDLNAILEELTSIKLSESGLTDACMKCCLNMKFAHRIQQRILKSDKALKASPVFGEETEIFIKQESTVTVNETQCVLCEIMVEDTLIDLHMKSHFENTETCNLCKRKFQDFVSFKEHLLDHSVANLVFVCDICSSEFQDRLSYNKHLTGTHLKLQYHSEELIRQKIVESGFRSSLADKLIALSKRNQVVLNPKLSIVKPQKIKRQPERENVDEIVHSQLADKGIGKSLAQKLITLSERNHKKLQPDKNLRKKVKSLTKIGDFPCDKCNLTFETLEDFNRHPHGKKPCPICNKQISSSNIYTHIKTHKSSPQICHYCGRIYSNAEGLRSHVLYQHENTKVYKCGECNVEFRNRNRFYCHNKQKHANPEHVCDICGKRFFYMYNLKKHMAGTHLHERPFACKVCNQKFSGRYVLAIHMRKHTNETPFRCDHCSESYRQRVSLKNHLKRKHNITEKIIVKCEVCSKGFASEHALLTHTLKIHGRLVKK